MEHIQTFQVFPAIPPRLAFLETLSRNLWWSWKKDAAELFRRMDPQLWSRVRHNPVLFLSQLPQERLEELVADEGFLSHMQQVEEHFNERVQVAVDPAPFSRPAAVAYFSMEFGIHESIPLFAGGLGVLAGDHLKAASSLALPLVGVGLLYREGYFRQFLNRGGWQQETYPETDLFQLPLQRARHADGREIRVAVAGPEGEMRAAVWKLGVGRVPLYLLDTNLEENPVAVRNVTARLYDAESGVRLAQEMLLGIGGMRALTEMGIEPAVCHMNEGHSAFCSLERLAQTMERRGVDLPTALEIIPRATVFTTHTPVPAGHDEFPPDQVRPYLEPLAARIGVPVDEVVAWGQPAGAGPQSALSMFVLGLRMAQHINGVSALHGEVARRMWSHVWPRRDESEVPIGHVTNGVHVSSFLSRGITALYQRYLGPEWYLSSRRAENGERIAEIYAEELWRSHEMSRARLIRTVRAKMVAQYGRRNAPAAAMHAAETVLDPEVLTIGFARRFATYKRATLLLQDSDRLKALMGAADRPVQFIFAGKAHPRDNEGKELIRRLVEFTREEGVRGRMVFLEDYDMHLARHMVQGCDVWLNTPLRPHEACGTSGMKAALNGVLNVSILDGWWCEGYHPDRGWRIGTGEEFDDAAYQDQVESQALYNVLEDEVIPWFYERGPGGLPDRWIAMMKASMRMAMESFCSLRMVEEYRDRFYLPAAGNYARLTADGAAAARELAARHDRYRSLWHGVGVAPPVRSAEGPLRVGEILRVSCEVQLGELSPEEVAVELFCGAVQSLGKLTQTQTRVMEVEASLGEGRYRYGCGVTCRHTGRYGFTVRVMPQADDWIRNTPGLIAWA